MKQRKFGKILCILMAMAMLFTLVGCSSDAGNGSSSTPSTGSSTDASTPSSSTSGEKYEWKLGCTNNDPTLSELNGFGECTKKFCDLVAEKSNGAMVITPYYNSVLGGDVQCLNDCRDGALEVYHGNPMASIDARLGFKAAPYLFKDFDMIHELIGSPEGPLFQMVKDILAEQNCYVLSCGTGLLRGFANSKHPVARVGDLKDLTVRTYEDPTVAAFWNSICNATVLPYSEVYTSLQTGTVDGVEMAATIMCADKVYDVTKYYSEIQWQWVGEFMMVNMDLYNGLSDELKTVLNDSAWEAVAYEDEKGVEFRAQAHDKLREYGIEVYIPTEEEMVEWQEYGRSTYDAVREIVGAETFDKAMEYVDAYNEAH